MAITNDSEDKGICCAEEERKPWYYSEQQFIRRVHHFYLSSPFEDPILYVEMMHMIRVAGPEDTIYLHLNTPGGNLTTGAQLISAIQSSQAHIIAAAEGEVCSLGTIIFFAADEFIVHDNCLMMFHNFSSGTWGKGHEQVAQLEALVEYFNDLAQRLYIPFLSAGEVSRIAQGEDIWMQSEEVKARLQNMVTSMEREKKLKTREMQKLEDAAVVERAAAIQKKEAKRLARPKKAAPKKKVVSKK